MTQRRLRYDVMTVKITRENKYVGVRIVGTVTETYTVYVVVGTCGDKVQYWAAAVPRSRAAQEVRKVLGSEWKTKVTIWRLPSERLSELKLKPNSVRKIGWEQPIP